MTDTNLPLDGAALDREGAAMIAKHAVKGGTVDAPYFAAWFAEAERLRARVAELEHDEATLLEDNDLLKARANALRDALEDVLLNRDCACYEDGEPNCCDVCAARYADAAKSLSTTPRANLAAYRASVDREWATALCGEDMCVIERVTTQVLTIRALAAQEVK